MDRYIHQYLENNSIHKITDFRKGNWTNIDEIGLCKKYGKKVGNKIKEMAVLSYLSPIRWIFAEYSLSDIEQCCDIRVFAKVPTKGKSGICNNIKMKKYQANRESSRNQLLRL